LLLLLTGCQISEDFSGCLVDGNLTLEFHFEAATGRRLTERISSIDVLVFDDEGRFVDSRRLERAELAVSPYARFTLWPGDYLVTAWANISASHFSPLEKDKTLIDAGYIEMTGAGDSLYYAPSRENKYTTREAALRAAEASAVEESDPYAIHRVHVPNDGGRVVKELPLIRAYRAVNIYFRGLEYLPYPAASAEGRTQMLSVEAVNLNSRYDLLFNSYLSSRRNHSRLCSETHHPSGRMQTVRFFMAYAPITNDIAFRVGNLPADIPSLTIGLAEYLKAHQTVNLDDIEILVVFAPDGLTPTGVKVSIMAPNWETENVTPII
jgi:hypothetical protein